MRIESYSYSSLSSFPNESVLEWSRFCGQISRRVLSRRDFAMVAWHEMPGKCTPKDPSRRDGMIGATGRSATLSGEHASRPTQTVPYGMSPDSPPNIPPEVPVPPEQPPLPVPTEPIPGPIPTRPTPVPTPPEPIPPNTPEPNRPPQPMGGVRSE
jgi:hypothetical protein